MQSLNPVANPALAAPAPPFTPSAAVAHPLAAPAADAAGAKPGVAVALGGPASAPIVQTYAANGALAEAAPVWERGASDAISNALANNYKASTLGDRFDGLGSALLQHFLLSGGDYSQSVIMRGAGSPAAASASAIDQARQQLLHTAADNQIGLDIQTAGGATVHVSLSSQGGNLGVRIQVTSGSLGDAERTAIAGLADAFQGAIDGLTSVPPKLALADLTRFDTSVLSSVDLTSSFKLADGSVQTLAFHADNRQRSVAYTGAAGTVNVSVDMSNPALLGSTARQARALSHYLAQFDQAQNRGRGDAAVMTMFKDAFKALNGNYPPASTGFDLGPGSAINDTDRSMLTGLADFSASVSDATAPSINPLHPEELDTFAYQVSQHTEVKGQSGRDRAITQTQQSHLTASYHQQLYPDTPLNLTADEHTQNYYYDQLDDSSSSVATIGYKDGVLAQASITQSVSQSTRIQKYLQGELQQDLTTPDDVSKSWNFLKLLDSAKPKNNTPQALARRQAILDSISDFALMRSDPTGLRGAFLGGAVANDPT
jgi:hypothetical protein